MGDRNTDLDKKSGSGDQGVTRGEAATTPNGQEVGPPEERVDDETGADESKCTHRQD